MENVGKILSCSDDIRHEYCATVVRIGPMTMVEGSDFLAKTDVLGTQIVVRKDTIHEGDIVFYAANETQLNNKFLSVNNLYEIGCRDMNSNAPEVNRIMQEYEIKHKRPAEELKNKAKSIKNYVDRLTVNSNRLNKKITELRAKDDGSLDPEELEAVTGEIAQIKEIIDYNTKKCLEKTVNYTNAKKQAEKLIEEGKPIVDEARKLCGFFNKYGRVRCIVLKGEPSFGFIFTKDLMGNYCPEISDINLEDYVDQDFDTVNGKLFIKVYVPPIPKIQEGRKRDKRLEKTNKRANEFDRMIEGEFCFHYDTEKLDTRNIHAIKPTSVVSVTAKLHGIAAIVAKVRLKEPKKINLLKRLWNNVVDSTELLKRYRFIDYNVVYGPIYASRRVIRSEYINNRITDGVYESGVWAKWGNIIYPYLDEGMTVYGEIIGWETNDKMIQKFYDYGCKEGENKLMIYRITVEAEDGTKKEWNVSQVYDWTLGLIYRMKAYGDENFKQIHPIDILYHGCLSELYPDVGVEDSDWGSKIINRIKDDREHFGMEEYEPLCEYNQVPREGIVIRIDDDVINRAFKLKTTSFFLKEALLVDSGEVDSEMLENYGEQ